jgi:N-acetylneuraminic acid mutarotase
VSVRLPVARVALAAFVAAAASAVGLGGGERARGAEAVAAGPAGQWRSLPSSPQSRSEIGAARIGGFVYAVGGTTASLMNSDHLLRYEIKTGDWAELAKMPVPVNHPAVTAYRGRIYVHGGYTGFFEEVDALQSFDPATGAWTRLTGSGAPRAAGTLAAVGDRILSIGGVDNGKPLDMVQAFDPRTGRWSSRPSLRIPREHLASAVIETKGGPRVVVLGGRSSGKNLANVESYGPGDAKWRVEPSLRTPRSGFGAATIANRVIAVGGEELTPGGTTIAGVELYRQERRRWRPLPPMPTARHGHGVVAAGHLLFAIEGGAQPGGHFSTVFEMIRLTRRQLARG